MDCCPAPEALLLPAVGQSAVPSSLPSSNAGVVPCGPAEVAPYSTAINTSCGRLCLYRKKINLSTSLAGQAVGVKEVGHSIWLISFMDYDLGYIELKERTLQPLKNPFGPKVSPIF
jgi:hypothetical protein